VSSACPGSLAPRTSVHEREGDAARERDGRMDGWGPELETHAMACKLCVGQKLKYGAATQAN